MQDLTKRAVILSAMPVTPALSAYLQPGDTVVACDAGYRNAAVLGIQPDLIVGDFDSAPKPETTGDMIILPHVKDDTDTHYAAKWLCERVRWFDTLSPCAQSLPLGQAAARWRDLLVESLATRRREFS